MHPQSFRAALAALLVVAGCGDATGPDAAGELTPVTTSATGTPGWLLDDSLEVRLLDDEGRPVAGQLVRWSSAVEGAWFGPDTARTNTDGRARTAYAPGWALGPQQVEATAGGARTTITVTATGMALRDVARWHAFTCGVDTGSRLWCWSTPTVGTSPRRLTAAERPTALEASRRFAVLRGGDGGGSPSLCAIEVTGNHFCMNGNDTTASGALPAWSTFGAPVRFREYALFYERVSPGSGYGRQCGVDEAQVAWCSGRNSNGESGHGTTLTNADWIPVNTTLRFRQIRNNSPQTTCGLAVDGTLHCWGNGARSLVSDPPSGVINLPRPSRFPELRFTQIALTLGGWCGITNGDSRLLCFNLAGPTPTVDPSRPSPVQGLPTTATSLWGDPSGGWFVSGGRLHRLGFNTGIVRYTGYDAANTMVPSLSNVVRIVSSSARLWCVEHASRATICGVPDGRPAAVPLPLGGAS